jgi:hypothetical protein
MQSKATTVQKYLSELPPDRRQALQAVREVILKNLDRDYEEGMQYGMIGYYVPHRVFPAGYHCDPRQPLPFASLASQKGHMSLHLMCTYLDSEQAEWLKKAWAKTGKKLDMGKACIRFKKVEDLALDVIGEAVRRAPAKAYIARYQSNLARSRPKAVKASATAAARKPARADASEGCALTRCYLRAPRNSRSTYQNSRATEANSARAAATCRSCG